MNIGLVQDGDRDLADVEQHAVVGLLDLVQPLHVPGVGPVALPLAAAEQLLDEVFDRG